MSEVEDLVVRGHRISGLSNASTAIVNQRFWQMAILTAAAPLGATPPAETPLFFLQASAPRRRPPPLGAPAPAEAALFYWQDSEPGWYRPAPPAQPRPQRTRTHSTGKTAVAEKETGAKPQGPLIITISIDQQKVRIYDANGFFAESPVSTGMKGHPTPMGVFSVISQHKLHHSNIYSGAPMPYMQRITWSGVAMHAGVLMGYPALSVCIHMQISLS